MSAGFFNRVGSAVSGQMNALNTAISSISLRQTRPLPGEDASQMGQLPVEVLLNIFRGLDAVSLSRAGAVCMRWREVMLEDKLWKPLYEAHCVELDPEQTNKAGFVWRRAFIEHNQPAFFDPKKEPPQHDRFHNARDRAGLINCARVPKGLSLTRYDIEKTIIIPLNSDVTVSLLFYSYKNFLVVKFENRFVIYALDWAKNAFLIHHEEKNAFLRYCVGPILVVTTQGAELTYKLNLETKTRLPGNLVNLSHNFPPEVPFVPYAACMYSSAKIVASLKYVLAELPNYFALVNLEKTEQPRLLAKVKDLPLGVCLEGLPEAALLSGAEKSLNIKFQFCYFLYNDSLITVATAEHRKTRFIKVIKDATDEKGQTTTYITSFHLNNIEFANCFVKENTLYILCLDPATLKHNCIVFNLKTHRHVTIKDIPPTLSEKSVTMHEHYLFIGTNGQKGLTHHEFLVHIYNLNTQKQVHQLKCTEFLGKEVDDIYFDGKYLLMQILPEHGPKGMHRFYVKPPLLTRLFNLNT